MATLNLSKSQKLNLSKAAPNMNLSNLDVELTWKELAGMGSIDLDLIIIGTPTDGVHMEEIDKIAYFNSLKMDGENVRVLKDQRSGGASEKGFINLTGLSSSYKRLSVAAVVFDEFNKGITFGNCEVAKLTIKDPSGLDMVFELDLDNSQDSAIVLLEFDRRGDNWIVSTTPRVFTDLEAMVDALV